MASQHKGRLRAFTEGQQSVQAEGMAHADNVQGDEMSRTR